METGTIRNPRQNLQLIHDPPANPLDLQQKSLIRALFKAKSVDPKTYSSPSFDNLLLQKQLTSVFHASVLLASMNFVTAGASW